MENINTDVQLKDNGWIKIVNNFVREMTPEEFFEAKPTDNIVIFHKNFASMEGKNPNIIRLYVKIQFLKPWKAKFKEGSDEILKRGLFGIDNDVGKEPDMIEVLDALNPVFNCNYRTTIFVTFFRKDGSELKTDKNIPVAYFKGKKRKMEMLPGETMYTFFSIPDGATDWYVWVPK